MRKQFDCHSPEGQRALDAQGATNYRCLACGHGYAVLGPFNPYVKPCPSCGGETEFLGWIIPGRGAEAWERNIRGTRAGHPWAPAA
jgi:hypothetical protein